MKKYNFSFITLNKEELQKFGNLFQSLMSDSDFQKIKNLDSCQFMCTHDEDGKIVAIYIVDQTEKDVINITERLEKKPLVKFNDDSYSEYIHVGYCNFKDNKYIENKKYTSSEKLYLLFNEFLKLRTQDDSKENKKKYEKKINGLEKQLEEAHDLNQKRIEEIDKWHSLYEQSETENEILQSKYQQVAEEYKKAQNQIEVYKDLLKEKSDKKEFTTREIAIIALALFRMADAVPKNKKNIANLFSKMTGASINTLGTNLCSSYTDEEIRSITDRIEDIMPVFSKYLKENKFAG